MRITTIAIANLKRRKGKAVLLISAISIGVATIVALMTLTTSIQDEVGEQLDRYGANILVIPQSNSIALDYGGVSVPGVAYDVRQLRTGDVTKVHEIPHHSRLSVVAPKVLSAVDIAGRQVLMAGVDFESELRLHRWWHIYGSRPAAEDDVLVGFEAGQTLGIVKPLERQQHAGPHMHQADSADPAPEFLRDHVKINGVEHRVAGVIGQTGGPEDRMVFGSLGHVQQLVHKLGEVSVIEVSALCKGCPIDDIVSQIQEKLPHARVSAIQQAVRARTEMVQRLTRFSLAVSAVVLVIGALMIFTAMTAAVAERTKEIGVLRAIGFRRVHVIQEMLTEVGVISLLGGVAGWMIGVSAGWSALPFFAESVASPDIQPLVLLIAVGSAVSIGMLSSIYPVLRASKLDPSESVRAI